MFAQVLLALILGLIAGTITGLFPGLHINLVAILILTYSATLLQIATPIILAVFLASMAITHTFLDTIPAIFLGVPEEATALSVLPGHELLIQGRGYEAVKLTVTGSFLALFVILFVSPLFILYLSKIYASIQNYLPHILIIASSFLIIREQKNRLWALSLFLLAGILGTVTLNMTVINQPLFPLLSGLFGTSLLSISFLKNVKLPKQKIVSEKVNKKETAKALGASIISGGLVSFLPGLGPAQGAVIGNELAGDLNRKNFLVLLGAIGTITMGLGFVALHVISKPRHGVAVVIGKLIETFTLKHLLLLLAAMFVAGSLAVFLTLGAAKLFARGIVKINYRILSGIIIGIIAALSIIISGWIGLLVLSTSTFIGIICSLAGVRKMHLMGVLLVPVILWFLI